MTYISRSTEAATQIITILKASGLFDPKNVHYGDSDYIREVPACTVEASTKARELSGATFRTEVNMDLVLMVYTARLTDDEHTVQLEADRLAEEVEAVLHTDPHQYLKINPSDDPLILHGFVIATEHGYALRNDDEILRASRMLWRGTSKVAINA